MARIMSKQLTGNQIDGIWHTSVVVFGTEYYFGQGIQTSSPGKTHHGLPIEQIEMGSTEIPFDVFNEFIADMREIWTADKYHLLDNNCNNFTNTVCEFLVGKGIPSHIVGLPEGILNTPFGQAIRPMIENMFGPSKFAQTPVASTSNLSQTPNSIKSDTFTAYPPHPHLSLSTPILSSYSTVPLLFTQSSPLPQIYTKIDEYFDSKNLTHIKTNQDFISLKNFLQTKIDTNKKQPLPANWAEILETIFSSLPEKLENESFPLLDIMRLLILEQEVRDFYMLQLIPLPIRILEKVVNSNAGKGLLLMAVRLASNMFYSESSGNNLMLSITRSVFTMGVKTSFRSITTSLLIESLLFPDPTVRQVGASLLFNISLLQKRKIETFADEVSSVHNEWVCEVLACLLKALDDEVGDVLTMKRFLAGLGFFLRGASEDVFEFVRCLEGLEVVKRKREAAGGLCAEVLALME